MAKFTRIEVHFVSGGKERKAIIRPLDQQGHGVQQILLDHPGPFDDRRPKEIALSDGSEPLLNDGPLLCYRVNGEEVCW